MRSSQKKEKFFQAYIMQIENALILSAGLGTRMGEHGKKLPKVLWPVFSKSLLELQIRYCKDLGVKSIYINTHFLHGEIKEHLRKQKLLDNVTLLHEIELLDSGGAIHNLAEKADVNYKGELLLLNGDQFLFFDKMYWENALQLIKTSRAVLFGIKVESNAGYNETVLKDGRLVEIKKNEKNMQDYITYSGLGVINLNGLRPVPGKSKFFESVAEFQSERIEFVVPDTFDYWDFGTAENYVKNIFKLSEDLTLSGPMQKFLKSEIEIKNEIESFVDLKNKSIDLDNLGSFLPNSIHLRGQFQKI